jgi:hypothetical protein
MTDSKKEVSALYDFESLRLNDFIFNERFPNLEVVDYSLDRLSIADLTLIIGDNAQGRTRVFKTLLVF